MKLRSVELRNPQRRNRYLRHVRSSMKLRSVELRNVVVEGQGHAGPESSMKLRSVELRNSDRPRPAAHTGRFLNEVAKRGASQSRSGCRPPRRACLLNEVAKRRASQSAAGLGRVDLHDSSMKLRSVKLRNSDTFDESLPFFYPQ